MIRATALRVGASPVKGTRHLELPELELDRHGAVGDRRFCLIDPAARRVLRTVQHPELVPITATLGGDVLTVTLADGRTATGVPRPGAEVTCEYWGREASLVTLAGPHTDLLADLLGPHHAGPVVLAAAPPHAVVYGAGVTLVAQSSIDALAERVGHEVDPARFRASVVLDRTVPAGAEDDWRGELVQLGSAVLRIGEPVGRCAVIDIDPGTGGRESRLLRTLAGYRPRNTPGEPVFGVYAEVVHPGVVTPA